MARLECFVTLAKDDLESNEYFRNFEQKKNSGEKSFFAVANKTNFLLKLQWANPGFEYGFE